jgi:hypothetical protein
MKVLHWRTEVDLALGKEEEELNNLQLQHQQVNCIKN